MNKVIIRIFVARDDLILFWRFMNSTQSDIFREKIKTVDPGDYFDDYYISFISYSLSY